MKQQILSEAVFSIQRESNLEFQFQFRIRLIHTRNKLVGKTGGARWKSMSDANEGGDSNKSKSVVNDDYDDEERMSEVAAVVKEKTLEWEEIISFIINLHIVLKVD
ncbi:hypothetical protein AAHE18_13G125100 [Arachis hypogaea]